MTIKLTKKEFREVMDDGEEIDSSKHHRHNIEYITIVFPYNGSFYRTTYERHGEDGIEWESFYECDEVEQVEVVVKEWRAKR